MVLLHQMWYWQLVCELSEEALHRFGERSKQVVFAAKLCSKLGASSFHLLMAGTESLCCASLSSLPRRELLWQGFFSAEAVRRSRCPLADHSDVVGSCPSMFMLHNCYLLLVPNHLYNPQEDPITH